MKTINLLLKKSKQAVGSPRLEEEQIEALET